MGAFIPTEVDDGNREDSRTHIKRIECENSYG